MEFLIHFNRNIFLWRWIKWYNFSSLLQKIILFFYLLSISTVEKFQYLYETEIENSW